MLKLNLEKLSSLRKIVLTATLILYALAILGNLRHGIPEMVGITLFFIAIVSAVFLWVK